jgi:DNA-directed RNA polymerase specialized sigma24 family protein
MALAHVSRRVEESPQIMSSKVVADAAESDDRLLKAYCVESSRTAFDSMITRHASRVWTICSRVLKSPNDIEVAFIESFRRLATESTKLTGDISVQHWLADASHRISVGKLPKELNRKDIRLAAQDPDPSVVRDMINEEVNRLPEPLRQPIVLCYVEGLTNIAAARYLGVSVPIVKERLDQAREKIKTKLAQKSLAFTSSQMLLLLPQQTPFDEPVPRRLIEATLNAVFDRKEPVVADKPAPGLLGVNRSQSLFARFRVAFFGIVALAIGAITVGLISMN